MNSTPLLSIIVTAHNSAFWLQKTLTSIIESINSEDLKDCEFILTNDGSEDETQQIIDDFIANYAQAFSWKTAFRNIGKVRNFAISKCRGDYILMVDGDDRLLPEKLSDKLKQLRFSQPDIYLTKLIEVAETETIPLQPNDKTHYLSQNDTIKAFLVHRAIQAHVIGQFFRRSLLASTQFPDFTCYEDAWIFPQLLMKSQKTLYSHSGFYLYIKRSQSLSGQLNPEKIRCLFATLKNMDNVFPIEYHNLISCHWINFTLRHYSKLDEATRSYTQKRIKEINKWSFISDPTITFSHKRKWLKAIKKAH